jgi:hypothetical protein
MDDHIARIDQHPIALRQSFDPRGPIARLFQSSREMFGCRRNVTLGPPGGDHERIAQCRPSGEVDRDDVFGFVVVEGREDARKQTR